MCFERPDLITQLRDKMQPTLDVIAPLSRTLQIPFQQPSTENATQLPEMMPNNNIDGDVLAAELEVFNNIVLNNEKLNSDNADEVIQFAYEQRKALPLTWKSYKLMLTAPTFSRHLKFVKSVYSSTMGDKGLTDALDMNYVLNKLASKPRSQKKYKL